MLFHQDATFEHLIIHHVGNKSQDEYFTLSDQEIDVKSDEILADLLMQYFMKPFAKANEVFRFFHPNETLELNEVFYFTRQFFNKEISLVDYSKSIARFLYEVTEHPKIKSGELYVVALDNVQMEGEDHRAVGIFKSENKESYLKVYPQENGLGIDYEQQAININKLDKGVIIVDV